MGTHNRNHCPFCLWSKHVDSTTGNREVKCYGAMEPIGLTFKKEGLDKWGKPKQGELMIIHKCSKCSKLSINRIASDDKAEKILEILDKSSKLNELSKKTLEGSQIKLITEEDRPQILIQLFGKS